MNFIDLLNECHIPNRTEGHEHCRPGWVQIDCPWCSPESGRFRLGYNMEYGYSNCWHCGSKPVEVLLRKLLGVRFWEAKSLLKDIRTKRRSKSDQMTWTGFYQPPDGVDYLLGPHKMYLKGRGFDWPEIERLWHIQGIGIAQKLSWRIFIPIIHHEMIVSWTTRSIGDEADSKYISAEPEQEITPHKYLLYGEDYCRHAIVVVEGPLDVWGIGPGAAATFGLSYTSEQVKRIARYPRRAICFDNEPDAQKVAKRLADDLSAFPGETFNITLDSKDPGEAKQNEIKHIRQEILE